MIDTKSRWWWEVQLRALLVALVPVLVVWAALVTWTSFDMGAAWYALGLVVVPVTFIAGVTTRPMARRWARERGAVFEGEMLDVVHLQLLRTRVGRTLGVTLAFASAVMVTGYYNTHTESFVEGWDRWSEFESGGGVWALAAVAYAVASGLAEATKPTMGGGAGASAVLDRRHLPDLLDLGLRRVFLVYAVGAVIGTAVWVVARVDTGIVRPSPAALTPLFAGLVALAIAVWVARRPQRASDDTELAYDELTRTAAANALVGASVAMFGIHAAECVNAVWAEVPWWAALPGSVYYLAGLGVWFGSGTKLVFRTRRIDRLRSAA